ncbi:Cd(II)/Pb(II)-responsive transcriptional regulator [Alteromonas oceanisediminis]|uniref:Cd(II)/Pb(II)-responsive transcriptional regulator n=1 Tax=Alteromonas oceanisediminis TaxID=2836180 RepID=UPI001BDB4C54|nr:Cd(II)/Pb(II)-responsive transcriptional regulator [Alteromonas oceanisediminis]MBT0587990.1 Cd(II)/Pb(II)-responsive transcriptional regulator [Alteromonas oceanisediminis]
MKIGELSKKSGCSIQTIRFYEREKLISPCERTDSNYRLYDLSSLSRLRFIRQCRSLDMTLAEITQLLETQEKPETSCSAINAMIFNHMEDVKRKIEELNELKETLALMMEACNDNNKVKECGVLQLLQK